MVVYWEKDVKLSGKLFIYTLMNGNLGQIKVEIKINTKRPDKRFIYEDKDVNISITISQQNIINKKLIKLFPFFVNVNILT